MTDITVNLPDGRSIKFPAGTPMETINRVAREAAGMEPAPQSPAAPSAQPADPAPVADAGPKTTALGMAGNSAEGLYKGLAALVGLPVDAINAAPMLLNLLPGEQGFGPISDDPVGGSAFLNGLLSDAGVVGNFEPATTAEKYARRIGEEIGATALPVAGATMRGARLAGRGIIPSQMSPFDRTFVAEAQRAPVTNAVKEGVAAAGAGAGAQYASDLVPDTPAAEVIGGIAGGVGAGGAVNFAENVGRTAASLAPGSTKRAARDEVGRRLFEAANDPRVLGPGSGARAADNAIPGVEPTVSQSTGDLGLEALEASRRGGSGKFSKRGAEQNAALQDQIDALAPNPGDEALSRKIMEDAEAQALAEFEAQKEAALAEARRRLADRVAAEEKAIADLGAEQAAADPGVTREGASRVAAERVVGDAPDSAINRFRETRNRLYGEVDKSQMVPTDASQAAAAEIVDSGGRAGSPPPEIARIAGYSPDEASASLSQVFGEETPDSIGSITLGEAQDDLTVLGGAATEARRAGRDGDARKIEMVRDAIRADIEAAADGSAALKAANAYEKAEYAPRFREGAAQRVRQKKAPPNEYLDRVFSDPNEADRFIKTVEGDERAMKAAEEYMLADLTRKGSENLTAANTSAWLRRNQEVLERFPEVRARVEGIRDRLKSGAAQAADARKEVKAAEAGVKDVEKWVPPSRDEAIKLYADEQSAKDGVAAILRSKQSARNLSRIMNLTQKSPEAQAAIKRGFVEHFKRKVRGASQDVDGAFLTRPKAMGDFLEDYGKELRVVFRDDPQHVDRLKEIATSLNQINDLASQAPLAKVNKRGDRMTLGGLPLTSVMSRMFAAQSGRTSYRYALSEGIAQVIVRVKQAANGPMIDELLDEALLDPKLAEVLTARYSKANDRRAARALENVAARMAARAGRTVQTSTSDGGDEDQAE